MDQQLKERLVGAVVLACAAIIVIPMVLSGRGGPPPAEEVSGEAPPRVEAPQFSSRIVPLEKADAPSPARREPAPPPPPPPARKAAPAAPPPPAPAEAPVDRAASAPPATGGWVVQLGSFSNAGNARALRDRLQASGFRAFVQSTTSGGAKVTRVFVGPEREREAAERMVPRLLEQTRLKGIVLRNPAR